MKTSEIMVYLGISRPTLTRYIRQGMPVHRPSPRKNLFDPVEVDAWIKRGESSGEK
ncbi:helix-turn-helix domain-containing protein [Brevibacillus sp. AY1]|uniref:helix-turn-helix domain-containing protein n=1 Tax=Brevibacillus borstelensis TaxID=45462 RepID=UPI0024600EA8|nr:helix-turn-helix domain-containing protein [Brevibacillus sp. AY1]